jgi:outer membrane receptor protein involved in Fe transport
MKHLLTGYFVILLGLVLLPMQVNGQSIGGNAPSQAPSGPKKLVGTIVDEHTGFPLEFAAISVLGQLDDQLITGGISDIDGKFEMDIQPGIYTIKIEYISYKARLIENVEIFPDSKIVDIGSISLSPDASMLEEIEVIAEKSQLQMGLDKKVFNVGKDLLSQGGNAADILDNIPSVTVDLDGNVALRGSQNVRILVDGKPSGLVGIGDSQGLQSMQGTMIESVEIITNPSAKYEAEGMSGIINIILKKQRQSGFNGSLNANAGAPAQYGLGANLNYRRSDINWFTSYGYRHSESPGEGTLYQEYYYDSGTTYLDQTRDSDRIRTSHNIRAGLDYFFNEKNILTFSGMYRKSAGDNTSNLIYRDLDVNKELSSITTRDEIETEDRPNLEWDLNFRRDFKKKGQRLNLSFQFRNGDEEESATYEEQLWLPDGTTETDPILQRSNNEERQDSYLAQADYEQPIGKDGKFETGYRGSFRYIDNNYLVEQWDDSQWARMENISNHFNYDEIIHAFYMTLGNKSNRFSYQAGLRWELSDVITLLEETNEENARSYNNFFPSIHLGYDLRNQNTMQISYSRRLTRPRFWSLNPFFTFSDSRNFYSGNPNLDPEYTDSYEIGHVKYWDKASTTASLYYRHTTGVVERIRTIDETGITNTLPVNLSTENSYGLELTYQVEAIKNWDVNGSFNFFNSTVRGDYNGVSYNADRFSWMGRLTSKWKVWRKVDIQLRGFYRAPVVTPQGNSLSMASVDIGTSMDIMKNNATITLNVRDLFNSRRMRYEITGIGFYSEGSHRWRPRSVSLDFSYRINQKKRRGQRSEGGFEGGEEMPFGG